MFNFMKKRPLYFNKNLSDYCTKTTNESVRKLTEKYNLERRNTKFKNLVYNDDDSKIPEFNFYTLLIFFSIPSIGFYFYKRLK